MDTTLEYRNPHPKRIPPTPAQRLLFRITYLIGSGILVAAALSALWTNRVDPYGGTQSLIPDLTLVLVGLGVVATMMVLLFVRLWKFIEPWKHQVACALSILVPFALLVLTWYLIHIEAPFRTAFALSRPALESAAAAVRADPTKDFSGQWAGVLPIKSLKVMGGETAVVIDGSQGFDTEPYLQWNPGGLPPNVQALEIRPVGHDWYWVHR